jgi:hypothetical protein
LEINSVCYISKASIYVILPHPPILVLLNCITALSMSHD